MIELLRFGEQHRTTPLVAVPGIDGSIGDIKPLVDGISKRRPVIVTDYRSNTSPTLDDLVHDIHARLRAEIDEPFYISGQSMGSIVASRLARTELPIQKVVLTGTFTILKGRALKISAAIMEASPDWVYRLTSRPVWSYVGGPVGDGGDHPFFDSSKSSDKNDIARRTRWLVDADFSGDLTSIEAPVLILMGDKDRYVPDAAEEIRKLRELFEGREDCRVAVLEDAGHVCLPSRAIETALEEIDRFLQ